MTGNAGVWHHVEGYIQGWERPDDRHFSYICTKHITAMKQKNSTTGIQTAVSVEKKAKNRHLPHSIYKK